MKYKKILLTGGSGKLGQAIIKQKTFQNILAPPSSVLNITNPPLIQKFFDKNDFDAVIHCAAQARMSEAESNPAKTAEINIMGTANLAVEVLKKEKKSKKSIRFIHISTDGAYPGTKGNYSEKDEAIPYNKYGWTKLGAEYAVKLLKNHCIIRASFFEPKDIKFDESAIDAYSSKVTIDYLVKAIKIMLKSNFIGIINIGSERKSDYKRYKEYKPSLRPCRLISILKTVNFPMAKDASMDCALWETIQSSKHKTKWQTQSSLF